jgi:hypothetical protein
MVSGAEVSSGPIAMLILERPLLRSEQESAAGRAFVRIDLGKRVLLDQLPPEASDNAYGISQVASSAALQISQMIGAAANHAGR